jgi:hypothetical protein
VAALNVMHSYSSPKAEGTSLARSTVGKVGTELPYVPRILCRRFRQAVASNCSCRLKHRNSLP